MEYLFHHPTPFRFDIKLPLMSTGLGKGAKKNLKCKLFPKGGGGSTPKFTFLKSLYTVKIGFKMDFLNTSRVLSEMQKKIGVKFGLQK